MKKERTRCEWCTGSEIYRAYHDDEWGVPLHEDRKLFEFLILEGAQAGLSWITVLKKRVHYRKVFDQFDPVRVAKYSDKKIEKLLLDPGIIRNRLKVSSAVSNARIFLEVQAEFGSFDSYIWQFTDGKAIHNRWQSMSEIPANSAESDAMSKDLKKRGFRFVGTTICYAFMQATGMINDHTIDCYRHSRLC
ncbi:DNA-3-methyladenine glycosylase 1 [bacterium BMS3Abin11]|nr:DNA-3-methyladenine glycosylase 1 [bacterium BMS3Abin11]GMT41280.1 MAG: DNA-3-methyladenine glycosylase [bacterium]HDH08989.1 DNA-3-methyladenine glycosylase I [Gammaproteobacteria bacterium]HDZ78194.1 DNA-3-methyladenine glycosylase I [Gammaproteobacteria bacterium]